jgi:hypothetical protein
MSAALTRRGSLKSTAAALFAGVAISPTLPPAKPPSPDVELIAACAEALRQDGIKDGINRGDYDGREDYEDFADDARDDWWEAFERVEDIPATTQEGVRAKARVLKLAVRDQVCVGPEYTMGSHASMHERMADALCSEILALGGVA